MRYVRACKERVSACWISARACATSSSGLRLPLVLQHADLRPKHVLVERGQLSRNCRLGLEYEPSTCPTSTSCTSSSKPASSRMSLPPGAAWELARDARQTARRGAFRFSFVCRATGSLANDPYGQSSRLTPFGSLRKPSGRGTSLEAPLVESPVWPVAGPPGLCQNQGIVAGSGFDQAAIGTVLGQAPRMPPRIGLHTRRPDTRSSFPNAQRRTSYVVRVAQGFPHIFLRGTAWHPTESWCA